ncbi:hypothetical protein OSB04_001837 [Centaurea solstitialis]|uniref:Uncharacterized protein n=1 Tax=Centaurea solstitialis TaxID=347529 RepID=A0AA38U2B1_9ASTR|nr:hypothetical protein OSB04_001837 [Centaurea solstitialis]
MQNPRTVHQEVAPRRPSDRRHPRCRRPGRRPIGGGLRSDTAEALHPWHQMGDDNIKAPNDFFGIRGARGGDCDNR